MLLTDDSAFESVLNAVFEAMDANRDGKLDMSELDTYVSAACHSLALAKPHPGQVQGIFRQLDLDNDREISRDELHTFLRHLFQEQVKFCALKLHLRRRK